MKINGNPSTVEGQKLAFPISDKSLAWLLDIVLFLITNYTHYKRKQWISSSFSL